MVDTTDKLLFISLDPCDESARIALAFSDALPDQIQTIDSLPEDRILMKTCPAVLLHVGICGDGWRNVLSDLTIMPDRPLLVAVGNHESLTRMDVELESMVDDIIQLPASPDELRQRIEAILSRRKNSITDNLKQDLILKAEMDMLVGRSENFTSAVRQIRLAGSANTSVLICGETGTGKELFARAIHYLGLRANQPFIPVNCGAIPESLFENEFFGHTRGAYTGASETREGLIHEAEGGTLFLDEINTLTAFSQVKLLRFLEDRKYKALGSATYIQSNVRIISAANTTLDDAAESGSFRQDLLYRINTITIHLPPLRDRPCDIPILAQYYLEKYARANNREKLWISDGAMRKLASHTWPGNVRELQHMMEQLAVLSTSMLIRAKDIHLEEPAPCMLESFTHARRLTLMAFEKEYVLKLLKECRWNVTKAAERAKRDRRWLQRLMRKHSLSPAANE
jgi:two-component system response regulator GlrR